MFIFNLFSYNNDKILFKLYSTSFNYIQLASFKFINLIGHLIVRIDLHIYGIGHFKCNNIYNINITIRLDIILLHNLILY